MRFSCLRGLPVVLTLLVACVPKDSGETDSDTGTSAGTGSASSTTETASTGEPTTGGSPLCEEFEDQAIAGPEVVVTIENRANGPAFVLPGPACTGDPLLELGGPGGDMLIFRATVCDYTCNDQFAGTCQCAADCALAPTIRIEAGGHFTYTWDGGVYTPVAPPAACFMQECGPGCNRHESAPAGDYTFGTQVGTDVTGCADDMALCTCSPNAEGWCQLSSVDGSMITGVQPVAASFAYPGDTAVTLLLVE